MATHPGSARSASSRPTQPQTSLANRRTSLTSTQTSSPYSVACTAHTTHTSHSSNYQRAHHPQTQPTTILTPPSPHNLPNNICDALDLAWAPATRQRYDISIRECLNFCEEQNIPANERRPASEMLLAMFAASLVGHIAGATISSKISAVHAWHIQHNDAWHGHTLLQYVLKGAANVMMGKAIQTQRQPITVNMLHKLFDELDLTTHLDATIYAVATIGFYAQLCMGEICAGKEAYTVFNRATSLSRKHLQPPHTPAGSCMLQLPWTKVKRTAGEEVAIC